MASRPSSIRFKRPTTSQGLSHTKLSAVAGLEGLERTNTRHESTLKSVRLPSSQTPHRRSTPRSSYITDKLTHTQSRPVSMIVENKRASTPAIPDFLSASYMTGGSSISRSSQGRPSPSSTQSITRRHSMLQFFGATKPTQTGAPVSAGTDAVLVAMEPVKPNPPSRRSRFLRFFGLHHARGLANDTNDFLAPGLQLDAGDRVILDRLDLKVLRKSR